MRLFEPCSKRSPFRMWLVFGAFVCSVLLLFSHLCVADQDAPIPLRVLMLFDEGPDLIALDMIEEGFETTLLAKVTRPIEFYHEYLDTSRFGGVEHHKLFADYLRVKYEDMDFDLIVPIVGVRPDWASDIPRELFPGVPIIFSSWLPSGAQSIPLVSEMTGVAFGIDVVKGLETALAVRPRTRRVIVVAGPEEMFSELTARIAVAADSHPGISVEYWTDRTAQQILESAALLPRDSLIFYLEVFRDPAGASFIPWEFGQSLARDASVPVFGIYESYLGTGIVGGSVVAFTSLGSKTAEQAVRVLNGERTSEIPVINTSSAVPLFDWNAMQRWDIGTADLPDGSKVLFRPPSLWETHRTLIFTGLIWLVLLSIVLIILIVQRLRRHQAELKLQQKEESLSLALDVSGADIWSLDRETGRLLMTARMHAMCGFAPDEKIDLQRFLEVVHPEDRELLLSVINQTYSSQESNRAEYRLVLPDGSERWILSQGQKHFKGPDHAVQLMGVSLDITESKVKEQEILQQKTFSEALINGLPGIFYLYDRNWQLVRWNRDHETLTGFSSDEMEKRQVLDWFSPPDKGQVARTVQEVFEEGESTVEAPLLLKDGTQVPYVFKGVRLEIEGEPYFLGMGIDISQRVEKELALQRSEQQIRIITNSLPALIAYVDSGERYIWVNRTYEEWWQLQHHEVTGKLIREVLGDDGYARVRQHVKTVLSGKAITFESVIPHPELGLREMVTNYVPDVSKGVVRGFFALIIDYTEVRHAQKQAQQDREALLHMTRVSTMSELGNSLAHELNQPLTAILASAQAGQRFIKNEEPDLKEIEEIFDDIVADDKRAGDIIHRLRAFLRKDSPEPESLDINDIVTGVLDIMNSEMLIRGISIRTELATDLPEVQGDQVQLEQVFINLIINAEHAMHSVQENQRSLLIKTSKGASGDIVVYVQDTGPGIDEDMLERIFDPFHTTKVGGIGMGLSISRSLVEANHGKIWAENVFEGGARFYVTLPIGDQV